jgi:hypothetical protein
MTNPFDYDRDFERRMDKFAVRFGAFMIIWAAFCMGAIGVCIWLAGRYLGVW